MARAFAAWSVCAAALLLCGAVLYASDGAANEWAKRAEDAFARDAELMREYNEDYAGGKWKGMMIQRHIGYTSWNDNFSKDRLPELKRLGADAVKRGGWMFTPRGREVVVDAEHWTEATCARSGRKPRPAWTPCLPVTES